MSPSLSQCHKHYLRNVTNSIIEMSQTVLSMSRTPFSISKNAKKRIIEKWKKHQAAVALRLQVNGHLHVTNTILAISRTLLS